MLVALASDHAGFELKEKLRRFLVEKGYKVKDFGAHEFNPDDDYTSFIEPLADAVSKNPDGMKGIILGGSGQGEAIDANRFKGVRAAVYDGGTMEGIRLSREHNDANVLSLGARLMSTEEAKQAVELWLTTEFSGDPRHTRRIAAIDDNKIG